MSVEMPKPDWEIDPGFTMQGPDWAGDPGFSMPTPGGLLDGAPEPSGGSGLELLMSPEEIAGIDGLGTGSGQAHALQDSGPMAQGLRDNSHTDVTDDKFSGQPSASNGIVEGDDRSLPRNPLDKTMGDVAGKVWNSPNSAIGMAYGGLGYLAGWPLHWLGLQKDVPGITAGNNAVQFTHNPFGGVGAITLGNVQVINGKPTDIGEDGNLVGPHEEQHTHQGEQLGPFYLPSNIFGGLAGALIDGSWHGPHNWNEVGPQRNPPVPWPK